MVSLMIIQFKNYKYWYIVFNFYQNTSTHSIHSSSHLSKGYSKFLAWGKFPCLFIYNTFNQWAVNVSIYSLRYECTHTSIHGYLKWIKFCLLVELCLELRCKMATILTRVNYALQLDCIQHTLILILILTHSHTHTRLHTNCVSLIWK